MGNVAVTCTCLQSRDSLLWPLDKLTGTTPRDSRNEIIYPHTYWFVISVVSTGGVDRRQANNLYAAVMDRYKR